MMKKILLPIFLFLATSVFAQPNIPSIPVPEDTFKVPLPPKRPAEYSAKQGAQPAEYSIQTLCFKDLKQFIEESHKRGYERFIASLSNPDPNKADVISVFLNKQNKGMILVVTKPDTGVSCLLSTAYDLVVNKKLFEEIFGVVGERT